MTTRINPSILAADFANLERELGRIATADLVHVDIMDNHFVPNLTFGLPMVQRLQQVSPIPLDVHLMITDVDNWGPRYAELGAFSVTFHAEASTHPVILARALRERGARAGIALKPGTAVLPTCWTSSANAPSAPRNSAASIRNNSAQRGVYSRSRTVPGGRPRTFSPVRGSRNGGRSTPARVAPGNAICISCRFGTR